MLNKNISSLPTLTLMLSSSASNSDNVGTLQQGLQPVIYGRQKVQEQSQNQIGETKGIRRLFQQFWKGNKK